jgi:NAD(P)-dependent dehydrogenase (short-subunit alcohol dehydrogenase family)
VTTTTPGLLDGKATLIIGASQGIGAAAARYFAAQGARLVLGARNTEAITELRDELRKAGYEAESVFTDVTQKDTIAAAVQLTVDTYGSLDAAFNNAGASSMAEFHEYSEEVYDHLMAVNLKGVFLSMQYEIRAMLAAGGGAIVNSSSVGGLIGNFGLAAYIASKHGVIGLTKAAAFEYGKQKLRVNALAIGTTATEMHVRVIGSTPPEIAARLNTFIPMDRLGRAEESAAAAAWLLSDQASYVTGATLPVDGGFLVP